MTLSSLISKRRAIIAIVALLALAPLAILITQRYRSEKAWNEFVANWEARGERFQLDHYLPAAVPDSSNLAHHPLFLAESSAFDAIQIEKLPGWDEEAYFASLDDLATPEVASWFSLPKQTPPSELRAQLGEPYRKWNETLDDFATALREREHLRHEVDWNNFFLSAETPDFDRPQQLGQALLLRATVRRTAGDSEGAAHDLVSLLRLARLTGQTPLLLTTVIQAGLLSASLDLLQAGLHDDFFGPAELSTLAREGAQVPPPTDALLQALRMERALLLNFLDHLEQSSDSDAIDALGRPGTGLSMFLIKIWMPANRLALCEDQQEIFLGPGGHYPDLARWEDAVMERLDCRSGRLVAPLGHLLLATFGMGSGLGSTAYDAETKLNHARIAIALKRFQLARGQFPDRLPQLVPEYLHALPSSAFDGLPIRYELRPDGTWRLWQAAAGTDPFEWTGD